MAGVLSVQKFSARIGASFLSNLTNVSTRSVAAPTTAKNYFTYSKEPSQPVDNVPKYVSAEDAVKCIKSGDTVFVSGAASTPIDLVNAMTEHGKANKLSKVTVCHMHTEGKAGYTDPECEGIFRSLSFFMAGNVRKAVAEGRSDTIPIFLKEIPLLFFKGIVKPDVALIHVSPPDQHGYCSLGTSVDCVRAGLSYSKTVIAQINPHMPRTFGDAQVHISHFDYAVNVDSPLPEHGGKPASPEEVQIGKLIAENLVEDGATLQMGIGNIPDSVLSQLGNHKDLGVHSEMFSGGLVDLVAKGAVTNNNKTHNKGKIIGSFLIGTKKLYDFVDNNPFIEMKEVQYVNGLHQIARNPKMTAINSGIEIDLTGQVVSDSIGTRMYSGFGGQVDFIRGAGEGYDGKGKPIIAMASISPKGISKIVPYIKEGAGVVTTRAHVQYVVTEQGIASLFGKSLRQRAYELIKIAHPSVRESLEKEAFNRLKVMPSP
ncbi:4-hydroxybutyrate coenzyme A transferase [Frankliniella occidentalis]|uniref:4-hydroxybutyrate coenzyme A transferase n=1 Tax=Frankliniella occidentalis TaxID=133901 RepID=A0A6J1S001_FRAOC|nr:4-hydroxybutyrate coenzyme A transferase [Frankliniella occidentalis]XP_052129703.1 4-hydroxybutyrate coenzyme A transferase [Frankliniella occidentalis]